MPRRGWSSVATPSGWYEVIRGPRPPSVQWPLAAKGKDKGKGKEKPVTVSQVPQKVQGQSKVARIEAALQALGPEQSSAKSAFETALKMAKEEVPKSVHPDQKFAEASARVKRLEAALTALGEDDPDAQPLKVALKQARIHARVRPVGERLDLCLNCIARVKKQVARAQEQVRAAQHVQQQMEEKLASGLRDLEILRAEASEQPTSPPEPSNPHQEMEVDPHVEIARLRAQVAELQAGQGQEEESFRPKKARIGGVPQMDMS